MEPRILLVDDEENVCKALVRQLRTVDRAGEPPYRIEWFTDPRAALQRAHEAAFDLVVSDFRMPEMDGVAFLTAFRALQPACARLILSGQTDLLGLVRAINDAGISRFLAKPWGEAELILAVESALRDRLLMLENHRLADQMRTLRGAITQQEAELRRLEREHPGITRVRWDGEGAVLLDDDGRTHTA